jgi:DNA polymerase III subunit chi
MTRVDFYVLASGDESDRLRTACRITEKAWQQGHDVYLSTTDPAQAALMDDLLWTFKQASFVPHTRKARVGSIREVAIGTVELVPHGGVHVNVAEVPLPLPLSAERVAEIIPASAAGRDAGRARFRAYREAGYELTTHNI